MLRFLGATAHAKSKVRFSAMFTAGYATTDYFLANGHRAAGTVTLVCKYDMFTSCPNEPSTEWRLAAAPACILWGYVDA